MTAGPVLARLDERTFEPGPLAAGPFAGLQGGVVAAAVAMAVEADAPEGMEPHSIRVDFVRPTPLSPLLVELEALRVGRRTAVYRALVRGDGEVTASAVMALARGADVSFTSGPDGWDRAGPAEDAEPFPRLQRAEPDLMDALDACIDPDGTMWFRWRVPLAADASAFALILPPADWAHGISRPSFPAMPPVRAFPNTDLAVYAHRSLAGEWLGIQAESWWDASGRGTAAATLLDRRGQLGRVADGFVIVP